MRERMKLEEKLLARLRGMKDNRGKFSELVRLSGVDQSAISRATNPNKNGKTQDIGLSKVSQLLEAMGAEVVFPDERPAATIHNLAEHSPPILVQGGNLVPVPVYGSAGAGPGVNFSEREPLYSIAVPQSHAFKSGFALQVDGHSMEPTLPHMSVIGADEVGDFRANELYVACIPYEGLVVKRVAVDRERGEFVFKSDNPDKETYPDFREPIESAEKIIMGRVKWVMHII